MDELIYLEPDEEITSVIDKIKQSTQEKLGVVVPREATLLQSVVNLRLILREAQALNKEISIVTADKIGKNLAAQVGLPVYNSIKEERPIFQPAPMIPKVEEEIIEIDEQAEKEMPPQNVSGVKVNHFQENKGVIKWNRQEKPIFNAPPEEKIEKPVEREFTPPPSVPTFKKHHEGNFRARKVLIPILLVFIVLGLVGGYLLVPKTKVTASVLSNDLKKNIELTVTNKVEKASNTSNVFPGTLVEASSQKTEKFTPTGKKNVGEKTKGNITAYNAWESSPRTFAAGTKFSNSGKIFLATSAFTIPGTAIREGNLVAGSVSVRVEAESPGEQYNIKSGRFTIIGLSSAQQDKIYGQSSADFTGGYSKEVQVVSQEDYDKAKQKIIGEISENLQKDLESKAKGLYINEKAVDSPDPEVTSSAKVEDEAKEFEMTVKLKKQVIAFSFSDFEKFVLSELEDQVPSNKMVAIASKDDIGIEVIKKALDIGEMDLSVNVLAKIASKVSSDTIKTKIIGKKITEAENYIKNLDGVENVKVETNPAWWPKKIPELARNVQVVIEYIPDESEQDLETEDE